MKNFTYLILLMMLIFTLPAHSQTSSTFVPDLDGKINSTELAFTDMDKMDAPTAFTVYTGFPLQGAYTVIAPKTGATYCNMDGDSDMEIIFGAGETLYAVNLDGSAVTGWPITFSQYLEAVWTCSVGDIDNDNVDEIVAGIGGPLAGWLYAFEKDGTTVTGFPVDAGKYPMGPVLSDLNNDGDMEILMGTRTGQLIVYQGDGTMFPGWPQQMDRYIAASVSVGDIDNNGSPNVVAESRNLLYAWEPNGTLVSGFPYAILDSANGSNSYSSPLLVDLTGDGKLEIVFGSHQSTGDGGVIYALDYTGTSLPGWPQTVTNWIYGAPIAADIDGDNELEILIGEYGSSGTPAFYIYAYNVDGSTCTNFPLGPFFGIANQLVIADLDADGDYEIIFDENVQVGDYGHYSAIHLDGTAVTDWPVDVLANSSFQQPLFGDLNNDGTLDMVGGSFSFNVVTKEVYNYAWNTGLPYDPTKIVNPMYQFGPTRNGVFIDPTTIPVELTSFTAKASGDVVSLEWSTATETNNSGFDIEKLVGTEWQQIGFVEGAGTTTEAKNYNFVETGVQSGNHSYRLKQIDHDGSFEYSAIVEVFVTPAASYNLSQNYPNPFNPSTTIAFTIVKPAKVQVAVYNTIGKKVAVLTNKYYEAGSHSLRFDASELPSGIYFYRLQADNFVETKKMLLLK